MLIKNYYSLLGYFLFVAISFCFITTSHLDTQNELAIITSFDQVDEPDSPTKKEFPKEEKEEEDSKEDTEENRDKEEKEEDGKKQFLLTSFAQQFSYNHYLLIVQSITINNLRNSAKKGLQSPFYILYACLKINS